jgi:hypothetical protein
MTHGCSPFSVTRRNLTPLDIVTAHSVIPGRDDVALLLEEAMRGEGWIGGKMEQKRRLLEAQSRRRGRRKATRENISKILELDQRWWGTDCELTSSESDSEEEDDFDGDLFVSFLPFLTNLSLLIFFQ